MTIDTDFHNHIVPSSAVEMAQSAKERGLRILGLSEHIFQMEEARTLLQNQPLEGPITTLPAYREAVRNAAESTHLDLRLGLEVDFVPGKQDSIMTPIRDYSWDFLIGSVHEIDGYLFERAYNMTRERGEELWSLYMHLLRQAASSGLFSLISHPVRMGVRNHFVTPHLDNELEQLAATATRYDVALEINSFDVFNYPHLVQRLIKACVLHKTPISVGSDAHRPSQIARVHQQSEQLLHEAGITTIRTWKQQIPEEYTI